MPLCFIGLYTCCGLETFYEIKPPYGAIAQNPADGVTIPQPPVHGSESRKFEFSTEANNGAGFIAPGTEVYYRIYNSVEKLQQDAKAVNAANTDVAGNGFFKMKSLYYTPLRIKDGGKNQDLLIEGAHRVVIRLADEEAYTGGVFLDGTLTFEPVLRNKDISFDLIPSAPNPQPPLQTDSDFDFSGNESGYWYVNAYAVSVGLLSSTWTRSVSKVLPLGFLAFKKE